MKKIMLVVPSLKRGGAERIVSILSRELEQEYDVTVVIFRDPVDYEYGGRLINLRSEVRGGIRKVPALLARSWKLRRIIRRIRPDRILSFMGNMAVILTGFKVYPSIHNNPHMYPRIEQWIVRRFYNLRNVKKTIVVSRGLREILLEDFGVRNVEVIYNPVDMNSIERSMAEPVGRDRPFILAVGSLHPQKGFDMLIDAYHSSGISRSHDLIILGEGMERVKLERQVRALGHEGEIWLSGIESNPFKYMKKARFLVMSSRYEGFGNVLVESLACGTPVISFDCVGGPGEIIRQGENGLLIPDGDVGALSDAISQLTEDDELYGKLRANARESALAFDISNIRRLWLEKAIEDNTE